jgi:MFS family permease
MPKSDRGGRVSDTNDETRVRRAAGRGLDWLNLFVANVQTGFGPFMSVYLTTQGWTQTGIGFALSIGTATAMASQLPAGALVDVVRSKSRVALFSITAFTASAMLFTIAPVPLFVYLGQVLHAFSSCTLGPAIVALSLAVAGQSAMAIRLGRNARYASIGNAMGAALMGAFGYYISERSVFFATAALTLPAIAALVPLARLEVRTAKPTLEPKQGEAKPRAPSLLRVLSDRRLLVFAACAALFTFANAAMLPLASSAITKRALSEASLLIAACIVLPQLVVALLSPSVGILAERRGRRPVLLLGFCIVPLRGVLLAVAPEPILVVPIQILDGFAAACFGVMMPLVTSDIAARSGHLNFCLGFVAFAIGIGATLSTTAAGWIADRFGDDAAFYGLAAVGLAATLLVTFAMAETRPTPPQ